MITFYHYPKCTTCQRAKKELDDLGISYQAIDLKENPPTAQTLGELLDSSDYKLKQLFNTSGNSYRTLGLKDKFASLTREEALDLLAADGMLIKRPLLVKDSKLLQVGHRKSYRELGLK
ncbi:arsenate reductase family protein [Streptococcus sobrinus]|uniref:arsenate reductase family protein n=1 Tax=Streptococcus sobrinus TaxID=1310 RepID=UPI0002D2F94C|nr:arsenate reductase family protein [Streptococcus sobrinus]